jgi:hypothetical protein
LEKELIHAEEMAILVELYVSKNICLGKILSVVQ